MIGIVSVPLSYAGGVEAEEYEELSTIENQLCWDMYGCNMDDLDGPTEQCVLRQLVVEIRLYNYLKIKGV